MVLATTGIARPPHRPGAGDPLRWFDGVWTAVALGAILFSYSFGAKGVLLILLLMPTYIAVRWRSFPGLLLTIAPILLLPAFAVLSALWSLKPESTFYYGVQYFLTVMIGATIGAGTDRRQALAGIFTAFAILAVSNLLFGRDVGWGGGGASRVTTAFAGLFGSKNTAADTAAVGVLVGVAMLISSLRDRRLIVALLALLVLSTDLWILRRAESTGALVACLLGMVAMVGWNISRLLSSQTRTASFLALGGLAAIAAALQSFWREPLTATLLEATGKDPTLTGRTYIWERAFALIETRPALGLGYNAFWYHGNIEAEGLWLFAGIGERTGFNFHNTFIEILVHLGIVGLMLYATVVLSHFFLLIVRTARAPTDLGILFTAYLSYVAVRLTIETQAFGPFSFSTTMVMAGLACAARKVPREPKALARHTRLSVKGTWRSSALAI
ncbi:O-antigen ligase family protein [Sphingomonas sp. S2-65]|uniref:O-antigen ligase family protein n=1 Tax=Sphingomonas sp. S2-65 TaxID=2903960 RepID=UPI001F1FA719|nr:O-antigen ligase family protein [Sphingomonas sp. S2-65]UYY57050.1 O-antigen ligase family protein [Sphingomonas sp. S2-65]